MRRIDEDLLEAIRTERGGWTKAQFNILGIMWPPQKGWKVKLYDKPITDDDLRRLMDLKYGKITQTRQGSLFYDS